MYIGIAIVFVALIIWLSSGDNNNNSGSNPLMSMAW